MANIMAGFIGTLMMLMCVVTSSEAHTIHGRSEAGATPSVGQTDYDEMMLSEMMTSEEEAEVDDMFPAQTRDDLKLELILKALVILKSHESDSPFVPVWLPPYDSMPDELKLQLILKALILLKNRPLDSKFAGHPIGELKLTLILKALWIIKEHKTTLDIVISTGDLKLALLLKAIDVLEVYNGEYKDIVFFTKSKQQLKLKLILQAITLLKHGDWPKDIDFWPKGEKEEGEGSQPEATTTEQTTLASETTPKLTTEKTATIEGATTTPMMTQGRRGRGDIPAENKETVKRGISQVFKWLKWVPKVHVQHKKKHHVFH
ncbi:uncharacterized protein [Asterias amurensis]|uniref:uncharacterized protein n=1 Tax=Asterias amurensis TaxID=7602 RepID=UPI003AB3AD57